VAAPLVAHLSFFAHLNGQLLNLLDAQRIAVSCGLFYSPHFRYKFLESKQSPARGLCGIAGMVISADRKGGLHQK